MDAAAARRQHSSIALAIVLGLAGYGLAGCANSPFSSSSIAPAETASAPPPAAKPALAKISVAPIIGAPDSVAKKIHEEFVQAVDGQGVSVAAAKEERVDYTLRGYIVAAKDKNATKVSYIWDVTDPSGKRVNRITGEEVVSGNASKDPWAAMNADVAKAIAGKAASSFLSWLPSHSSQAAVASGAAANPAGIGAAPAAEPTEPVTASAAAAPAPAKSRPASVAQPQQGALAAASPPPGQTTGSIARDGPFTAVVPSVTGAPGDGSTSLAAALQRELSSKGISVADKPTSVAYRVEGTVTVGASKDGTKQPIQIEWLVRDPQGKKLGTVSQKNEIPAGSLDGAWGSTAEQAAAAAAQGIIKLFPQQKAAN
jgi:hypothetical protein